MLCIIEAPIESPQILERTMGSVAFKVELMKQIAERLEQWAQKRSNDRVLLAAGYLHNLFGPLDKFDEILLYFQYHKPELSKSLERMKDRLVQLVGLYHTIVEHWNSGTFVL